MLNALIVIPARLEATRLPGKPLAEIAGEPMIVHVWRRACAAEVGRVVVATDAEDVRDVIRSAGGEAVMTRADHASGSDRVFEAINKVDPEGDAEFIINLQGDLPTLEPHLIHACIAPLRVKGPHITTLAAPITQDHERDNPNVVKVVGTPIRATDADPRPGRGAPPRLGAAPAAMPPPSTPDATAVEMLRALYFTRATAPHGDGPLYHHIGIYGYRRPALERFVSLRPSPLELRERLEQLRALEDGMRIDVAVVDTVPLGVDTPEDLERARAHFKSHQ